MKYTRLFLYSLFFLFMRLMLEAHPMPYSVMLLDVKSNGISADLKIPLKEFQVVFPNEDIDRHYTTLLLRKSAWLDDYLLKHLSIQDSSGHRWRITITGKSVEEDEQNLTGKYHELIYNLWLQPPQGVSPRHFIMHYEAIMHQLVTHKLFLKIRSDWDGGLSAKDSTEAELGLLGVNFYDNTIPPVIVNLDEGSNWKGFKAMVTLGIEHIGEGTDHLLFLFVLFLPATLTVRKKRWAEFGGTAYSLKHLLKIVTAFTIGHSLTLILVATQLFHPPQQPIELLISITILITAVHALRPLFPNKELYVACGFGLIHGMAFATVLGQLDLETGKLALSILGFNIGIELMQLFVILLTLPWFLLLSAHPQYHWFRITGALLAIIAGFAWMIERITLKPNLITIAVEKIASHSKWLLLTLACLALLSILQRKISLKKTAHP